MKLIKPSYEILDQKPGLEGIYEQIELAGRTCYKSVRPEGQTAKDFVDRMIKSQHYAMLEHGTIYLTVPYNSIIEYVDSQDPFYRDILCNPWIKYVIDYENDIVYISSNYRWIIENNLENWLQYLCEPTEFHKKRVTVRFTTSNGIMRELTRHRSHSFAIESTRYCNYSKNKFNNELTFIQPYWFTHDCAKKYLNKLIILKCTPNDNYTSEENLFLTHLLDVEEKYMGLINLGLKAQEAREVLPLATKCDMVMTGFVSDWEHLFRLRTSFIAETGKPHPDMSNLCDPLYKEFVKRGFIEK